MQRHPLEYAEAWNSMEPKPNIHEQAREDWGDDQIEIDRLVDTNSLQLQALAWDPFLDGQRYRQIFQRHLNLQERRAACWNHCTFNHHQVWGNLSSDPERLHIHYRQRIHSRRDPRHGEKDPVRPRLWFEPLQSIQILGKVQQIGQKLRRYIISLPVHAWIGPVRFKNEPVQPFAPSRCRNLHGQKVFKHA